MELKIASILRYGVLIAGGIILTGWLLSFNPNNNLFDAYKTYEQVDLIVSIKAQVLLQNWGRLLTYFGLFLLILLPVIRVFLSMILFFKHQEKQMALIGAIVFIGLLISFYQGLT